ncbi:uroporphyrinogen decarboxylase [Seonamhaeicola sp. S2-3]|nr:uroporphyrinogen decarboxylase [Seonamhaeicola sp. S2-3]APY10102.1 uroporphyrinogen decarboxylase [Seonamhaeicola sp. S2-3]
MEFLGVSIVEWVGYLAMATVLLSFLMKSVIKLRMVNLLGCLFFVIYGFMLSPISKPIIITNSAILIINLFYLVKKTK